MPLFINETTASDCVNAELAQKPFNWPKIRILQQEIQMCVNAHKCVPVALYNHIHCLCRENKDLWPSSASSDEFYTFTFLNLCFFTFICFNNTSNTAILNIFLKEIVLYVWRFLFAFFIVLPCYQKATKCEVCFKSCDLFSIISDRFYCCVFFLLTFFLSVYGCVDT